MSGPATQAKPFPDILVVCDGDPDDAEGVRRAAEIAARHGARLTALTVADCAGDIDHLAGFSGRGRAEIEDGLRADMLERLRATVKTARPQVTPDLAVAIGRPFRAIIADVLANGRDLVVKMAEPFDARHRYLFTSTDQHLLRKCPCPVWLAMPQATQPPASILAAIDLGDGDADAAGQDPLNRTILSTAMWAAAATGATIHVTHVWEAPAEDLVRRWTDDAEEARRYTAAIEDRRRQALGALIAAMTAEHPEMAGALRPHLARGRPREVIPAHIDAMGADLLVIGTLGRTGVPGLIIGNTAEDVLNAVDCSVLTVKPPGYVSPLADHSP